MRTIINIGTNVPAFIKKLWKLVNDPDTDHLISWGKEGKSFIIHDPAQFASELLPQHFKHNNMASFIRQLNMYGFHKISSIEHVGYRSDIEFNHQCFMKGRSYLLEHIKRKITNPKTIITTNEHGEQILLKPELMTKVLSDVKQMKEKQTNMDTKFTEIKLENQALWREVAILRQKHIKQQQIVNNLIQFLMSLVQPSRSGNANANGVGVKRPYQLMINNAAHNSGTNKFNSARPKNFKLEVDQTEDGPTIHELAHDDMLQVDESNVADLVAADLSDSSPAMASVSPAVALPQSPYEVTIEDVPENMSRDPSQYCEQTLTLTQPVPEVTSPSSVPEDANQIIIYYDNDVPVITIPTTSKTTPQPTIKIKKKELPTANKNLNLSANNFTSIPTTTDLPAEIFANDETNYEVPTIDNSLQEITQADLISQIAPTTVVQDQMVGGVDIRADKTGKSYSKKLKKKSSKKPVEPLVLSQIKTEQPDETDWNTMTLATVNNSPNHMNRRPATVNRRDCYTKSLQEMASQNGSHEDDIDDHLDTMQTDIDSLRELLRSESYSFDPNTILGLFGNEDPFYGLSFNNILNDQSKPSNSDDAANQLISYTGNVPDFGDIDIGLPDLDETSQDGGLPLQELPSTLNTPQMVLNSPFVTNVTKS